MSYTLILRKIIWYVYSVSSFTYFLSLTYFLLFFFSILFFLLFFFSKVYTEMKWTEKEKGEIWRRNDGVNYEILEELWKITWILKERRRRIREWIRYGVYPFTKISHAKSSSPLFLLYLFIIFMKLFIDCLHYLYNESLFVILLDSSDESKEVPPSSNRLFHPLPPSPFIVITYHLGTINNLSGPFYTTSCSLFNGLSSNY